VDNHAGRVLGQTPTGSLNNPEDSHLNRATLWPEYEDSEFAGELKGDILCGPKEPHLLNPTPSIKQNTLAIRKATRHKAPMITNPK